MRLSIARSALRLRVPLQSAYGTVRERELLTVCIVDSDGVMGFGEAAPLQPYDGVSVERVHGALQRYRAVLADAAKDHAQAQKRAAEGPPRTGSAHLLDACRAAEDLPQALAAIDMALWDLAGRRQGRPVAALLTDAPMNEIAVNATLSATDRAGAAAQAATAVELGFSCLKLKVGVGDDGARVAAVRAAAGPNTMLRLDANGAWSVEEAVRAIEVLEPAGLELVEEPCHGLEAVRAVREQVSVRVAIDETAEQVGALGAGVADAVLLEDIALWRHLGAARGRIAGQGVRRGGLPRLLA